MTRKAQGHFSKYACVFYLDDLKEVSEQTNDQVKYVCSHTCVSVVRIERVVNDTVWGRSKFIFERRVRGNQRLWEGRRRRS